jgi:hypothetical protein
MNLADLLTSLPVPNFEVSGGFADEYPNVRVKGLPQPAIWLGDYALKGEPIIVGLIGAKTTGQYVVLGRVGGPLPIEGIVTAAPGGSDTITVTADEVDYTVTFASDLTPTIGDRMRLLWQGGTGTAVCKVGITPTAAPPPSPTAPPPGAATTGVHPVVATDSGTYSIGYGWNSYFKQNIYQGDGSTWGAPVSNSGAWFYGSGANQINGSTVTGIQFRLPARNSAGASSAAGTVHIYLHNSPSKPGGDVTRVQGPTDVVVASGSPGGNIALPVSWGQTLIDGGGISITGSPYMGFRGRGEDPESGKLLLTWQR